MNEETPKYAEFEIDFGKCDREEDWWQYGKGGYDVGHKLIKKKWLTYSFILSILLLFY